MTYHMAQRQISSEEQFRFAASRSGFYSRHDGDARTSLPTATQVVPSSAASVTHCSSCRVSGGGCVFNTGFVQTYFIIEWRSRQDIDRPVRGLDWTV